MAWSVDMRAIGFLASDSGDPAWNWESVLNVYRRIEDWQGAQTARLAIGNESLRLLKLAIDGAPEFSRVASALCS
jgi:hypothetical protein